MSPDLWTDRLSEYLDGELSPEERAACERHLAGCAACRATLDDLRRVVAAAGRVDDRPPASAGLIWSGIAARIGATPPQGVPAVRRDAAAADVASFAEYTARRERTAKRRFSFTAPQLAAAAVFLMMVSGGGAALLLRDDAPTTVPAVATTRDDSVPPGDLATERNDSAPPSDLAVLEAGPAERAAPSAADTPRTRRAVPSRSDEAPAVPVARRPALPELTDYNAAVGELEEMLQAGRERLDPRTIQVLERNLAIIDSAIADARRAVEEDPENAFLRTYLNRTLRRKVELLRTATAIAAQS